MRRTGFASSRAQIRTRFFCCKQQKKSETSLLTPVDRPLNFVRAEPVVAVDDRRPSLFRFSKARSHDPHHLFLLRRQL